MQRRKIRTSISFEGQESKTQQHHAVDTNINSIVAKFNRGQLPLVNSSQPQFIDISKIPMDYTTMLNHITEMDQKFMKLDPKIRYRFRNNPQNLIDFLKDKENLQEAFDLGMLTKEKFEELKPKPEPEKVVQSTAQSTAQNAENPTPKE